MDAPLANWRAILEMAVRKGAVSRTVANVAEQALARDCELRGVACTAEELGGRLGIPASTVEDFRVAVASHEVDPGAPALAEALLSGPDDPPRASTTARIEEPPASRSEVPSRLGSYELLEKIGRGGMGIVYRARHERLGTYYAVKVLIEGEHASPEALARFAREAEAVARLGKHPNIVGVHDLGQEGRILYYSMDLVQGRTLREGIGRELLSTESTVLLIEKVALALHFAHQRGIVHRDVKPENILIDGVGEPQVLDFGLARDFRAPEALTDRGDMIGTLAYMAPEQARGDATLTDARTDVYALGVMLYELLVGTRPFPERSVATLIGAILRGDVVSPRKCRPDLPEALETVCLKCLERDPTRRYPTAGALAEDLQRWRRKEPILADARHAAPAVTIEASSRFEARWSILRHSPERLDDIVQEMKVGLGSMGVAPRSLEVAEHVVRELAGNAIEHGCRGRANGQVDIVFHATRAYLKCTVQDDGPGFDHAATLSREELLAQDAPGTAPRHGIGLLLVKRLVDTLEFNPAGNEAMALLRWDRARITATQTWKPGGSTQVLTVEGRLEGRTFEDLERRIRGAMKQRKLHGMVVDLSGCTYLSSSGVGALVGTIGGLEESGTRLVLVINSHVRMVLEVLGVMSIFTCVDRLEDAKALIDSP